MDRLIRFRPLPAHSYRHVELICVATAEGLDTPKLVGGAAIGKPNLINIYLKPPEVETLDEFDDQDPYLASYSNSELHSLFFPLVHFQFPNSPIPLKFH